MLKKILGGERDREVLSGPRAGRMYKSSNSPWKYCFLIHIVAYFMCAVPYKLIYRSASEVVYCNWFWSVFSQVIVLLHIVNQKHAECQWPQLCILLHQSMFFVFLACLAPHSLLLLEYLGPSQPRVMWTLCSEACVFLWLTLKCLHFSVRQCSFS